MNLEKMKEDIVQEMNVFYVNKLEWDGKEKSFSVEISKVGSVFRPSFRKITVRNPSTNSSRVFNFVKEQKDGSDEDTYYWLFECPSYKLKLYIWND